MLWATRLRPRCDRRGGRGVPGGFAWLLLTGGGSGENRRRSDHSRLRRSGPASKRAKAASKILITLCHRWNNRVTLSSQNHQARASDDAAVGLQVTALGATGHVAGADRQTIDT